jgi:hypothetical protein
MPLAMLAIPCAAFIVTCVGLLILIVVQCVRALLYESRVFVSMVLILIFAEVLGLYGYVISPTALSFVGLLSRRLIVALIMNTNTVGMSC